MGCMSRKAKPNIWSNGLIVLAHPLSDKGQAFLHSSFINAPLESCTILSFQFFARWTCSHRQRHFLLCFQSGPMLVSSRTLDSYSGSYLALELFDTNGNANAIPVAIRRHSKQHGSWFGRHHKIMHFSGNAPKGKESIVLLYAQFATQTWPIQLHLRTEYASEILREIETVQHEDEILSWLFVYVVSHSARIYDVSERSSQDQQQEETRSIR